MTHRLLRRTSAAIGVLAAVSLAGCSSESPSATGASNDVVIGYGKIDTLDPIQFKTNTGYMVTNNIYGTLVRENYQTKKGVLVGDNTYAPQLAESLAWDSAGTLLTIKLKPNLQFQDGTALNATDVVYSIQRSLSDASYAKAFKSYIGITDPATAITAVDPSTVTIKTAFKAPLMEKFLSFPVFGILEKAAGDAHKTAGDPWATGFFSTNVIASGPYAVQSWSQDSSIVLTKNPKFTPQDLRNAPSTVTVKNIADPSQTYLALKQGALDIAMGLPPKLAKQAQSDSNAQVDVSPAGDLVYLGMNNTDPALTNVKVRQALSYLLPYNSLRSDVMQGFANSAFGPAPYPMESSLDTDGTKDAYPTDVSKATQLLSEAGATNLNLTLSVDASDPAAVESATFIQSALKQGGITVRVDQLQDADYNTKLGKHQLQMFVGEWYSWGQDAIYQMNFLLSSNSFVNYTGFKNAQFDALLSKGVSESDVAARNQLSQQAQQIAIDQAPMAYLYARDYVVVANKNVSGITQPDDEFPYFQYLSVR